MRVLLADDQSEVRLALKILLEQETGLEIVEEVVELNSLITKTIQSKPDLILLDWELSNLNVSDMIPVLRSLFPEMQIIAMSVHPEAAKAALSAGVDAFASKGENSDKLLETITKIKGHSSANKQAPKFGGHSSAL